MKRNVFLLLISLCVFIFPSFGFAEDGEQLFDEETNKVFEVMKHLDMQGHADDDFSTCSMQQLYFGEIKEMFDDGMTKDEIIQAYVDEYGQAALREPGKKGSELIAWVIPVVAFLLGVVIVGFGLKKLTKKETSVNKKQKDKLPTLSETEAEILKNTFDEERRKHF